VRVTTPVVVMVWPFVIGPMGEEPQTAPADVRVAPEFGTPAFAALTPVVGATVVVVVPGVATAATDSGWTFGVVVVEVGAGATVVGADFTTVVGVALALDLAGAVVVVVVTALAFAGAVVVVVEVVEVVEVVVETTAGTVVGVAPGTVAWVFFAVAVAPVAPRRMATPMATRHVKTALLGAKRRLDLLGSLTVFRFGTIRGYLNPPPDLTAAR
jgi:hypothetical protein